MTELVVAALAWIGCHIGIAGSSFRQVLVARMGNGRFRTAFSVLSVLIISFLVIAYVHAPFLPLWTAGDMLRWILAAVMLIAFLLFATSVLARNPTAVGGEAALQQEPRGILRITRHPMLWSFVLWAVVHVIGNGDAASLVFFGAFLITALAGMPSIDAKLAARSPEIWSRFAAVTSVLPFQAIASRRNRLAVAEIGWIPVIVGLVLWVVLLWAHPWIFGVNPLPNS